MKLTAAALRQAAIRHFGQGFADRLAIPGPIDDADLADAFRPIFGDALDAELVTVVLIVPTVEIRHLSVDEARRDPDLNRLLMPTLGDAIAAPFVAGVRLQEGEGSVSWGEIRVTDLGGRAWRGMQTIWVGPAHEVQISAVYGVDRTTAYRDEKIINGQSLAAMGADARRLTTGQDHTPGPPRPLAQTRRDLH